MRWWPFAGALLELVEPAVQLLGAGFDGPGFERIGRGKPQRKRVFFVAPVEADDGGIIIVLHGRFWFGGRGLQIVWCEAW